MKREIQDAKNALISQFPDLNLSELDYITPEHLEYVSELASIEDFLKEKPSEPDPSDKVYAYVNRARETIRRRADGELEVVWQANFGGPYPFDPNTACGRAKGVTFGLTVWTWERRTIGRCRDGATKSELIGTPIRHK